MNDQGRLELKNLLKPLKQMTQDFMAAPIVINISAANGDQTADELDRVAAIIVEKLMINIYQIVDDQGRRVMLHPEQLLPYILKQLNNLG